MDTRYWGMDANPEDGHEQPYGTDTVGIVDEEAGGVDLDIRVIGIDNDGSAIYWDSESEDTWVDGLHFLEIESI